MISRACRGGAVGGAAAGHVSFADAAGGVWMDCFLRVLVCCQFFSRRLRCRNCDRSGRRREGAAAKSGGTARHFGRARLVFPGVALLPR